MARGARIVAAALAATLLMAGTGALAAPGDHVWSAGWSVNGVQMDTDLASNVYGAGTFFGTVDFGGGGLTGTGSVFVAKYDAGGTHVWSASYGVSVFPQVTAVTAVPGGGMVVAGLMPKGGAIDFGGGPLASMWIVQFDANGGHVWSDEYGDGVVNSLDATNGEVVATGRTFGTIDMGGGPLGMSGDPQMFVAKLTSAGAHVWSAAYGDGAAQAGLRAGILGTGDVVVAAALRGTTDFGGGGLTADSNDDLGVVRFDSGGGHVWSQIHTGSFGAFGSLYNLGLDVDDAGNVAIAGEFLGTVDFGGGVLTSTGSDVFALELNASGGHVWSASWGSAGNDAAQDVAYDTAGNLLVSGTCNGAVDFGGGPIATFGSVDAFVAAISGGGGHVWSRGIGSTSYDSRCGVARGAQGSAYLDLGGATGADFGGGVLAGSWYLAQLDGSGAPTSVGPVIAAGSGIELRAAPNPFRTSTRILFTAPAGAGPTVDVYDAAGRLVRRLADPGSARSGDVVWDGRSADGSAIAPGVYFVRVRTTDGESTERIVRLR